MPQFLVVFNDGGTRLVIAPDKYSAIEKAKSEKHNSDRVGVKEVRDTGGRKL